MKRKFLILLSCILTSIFLVFPLSACNNDETSPDTTQNQGSSTDGDNNASNDNGTSDTNTPDNNQPSDPNTGNNTGDNVNDSTGDNTDNPSDNTNKTASEGLDFILSEDGKYYILSGIGVCTDSNVVIPSTYEELPVKVIDEEAFRGCAQLSTVSIPNNVVEIKQAAFYSCVNLEKVVLSENITSIEGYTFEDCTKLVDIKLTENITTIGERAFTQCTSIKELKIPNAVNFIGDGAFSGCSALETISLPTEITTISELLFAACNSLRNITIPDKVTIIEDEAFSFCSDLTAIVLPSNLESIGESAFMACPKIKKIELPETLTSIGTYAFNGCASLKEINIPKSITSIGYGVFALCGFDTFVIPDHIESVGTYAFYQNTNLVSITVPESVNSIGNYAFQYCSKLMEVVNYSPLEIEAGSTSLGYIGYYALEVHNTLSKIVDKNGCLFITIGDTHYLVGYIGDESKIVLPEKYNNSQYSIYNYAFRANTKLEEIRIPESVNAIGDGAFSGCTELRNIQIDGTSLLGISGTAFYNTKYWNNENNWEDGVLYIDAYLLSVNEDFSKSCYEIKAGTYFIADYAFSNCSVLTKLVLPDTVKTIGNSAFYGCDNLISVSLGEGVTSIGNNAFYLCSKLLEVSNDSTLEITIGDDAYGYIGYYAKNIYNSNSGTSNITFDSNGFVTYNDGSDVFLVGYNGEEKDIVIPNEVTIIYDYAFADCIDIASVTLGTSVKRINEYAFSGCDNLVYFVVGENVTYIEDYAFGYGCAKLIEVFNKSSLNIQVGSKYQGRIAWYASNVYTSTTGEQRLYKENDFYIYKDALNVTLMGYTGISENLTIPNGVTDIFHGALKYNEKIKSIVFPSTVVAIDYSAFYSCKDLETITFSADSSLQSIGESAFAYCSSLKEIIIPDRVTFIGEGAYEQCISATKVVIGLDVQTIEDEAFSGCVNVETFIYNAINCDNLNGGSASSKNETLAYLGNKTKGVKVTIGNQVQRIPSYLFYPGYDVMHNITSVEFEDNSICTEIGRWAFMDSTITKIEFPTTLKAVDSGAFSSCVNLTEVYFEGTIEDWCNIDFSDWTSNPLCYGSGTALYINGEKITNLVIPNTVTEIKAFAFYNNQAITSITFSNSQVVIGECAFRGCNGLVTLIIPDSISTIGESAFGYCSRLTNIVIGKGVKTIESYAFTNCDKIKNVFYMGNVTDWNSIEKYASSNKNLTLADRYYYSESKPIDEGNYWHYINGIPTIWG